jgi:hypothetical protein
LDTSCFPSSFIKDVLLKDVQHVDLFPKMGDVQVAFEIITVATLLWPSVGVKPNTWKKLGLELSQA